MTTEAEMIQAVIEKPHDDTLRLAFADWLDEQDVITSTCPSCDALPIATAIDTGEAIGGCLVCGGSGGVPDLSRKLRAEFIRLQIQEAALKPRPSLNVLVIRDIRFGADEPVLRPDGHSFEPHWAHFVFTTGDEPKQGVVYDIHVSVTESIGRIRAPAAFTLAGAVCNSLLRLYDHGPGAYEGSFWVSGEADPIKAEKAALVQTITDKFWTGSMGSVSKRSPLVAAAESFINENYYAVAIRNPSTQMTRGFAHRLIGNWEAFLKAADVLLWTPKFDTPCPVTAHPIQEVRLLSWPRWNANRDTAEFGAWLLSPDGRERLGPTIPLTWSSHPTEKTQVEALLGASWPGIKFILPGHETDRG